MTLEKAVLDKIDRIIVRSLMEIFRKKMNKVFDEQE